MNVGNTALLLEHSKSFKTGKSSSLCRSLLKQLRNGVCWSPFLVPLLRRACEGRFYVCLQGSQGVSGLAAH